MAISDLRQGLADNLATIPNMRVYATLPDVVNPPSCLITLDKITYNRQMQAGMSEYDFKVTVVFGRVSERTAQENLDVLVAPGVGSVKAALESDKTLGGFAYDVFVPELSGYGALSLNGIDYLSAEFSVQVFAR